MTVKKGMCLLAAAVLLAACFGCAPTEEGGTALSEAPSDRTEVTATPEPVRQTALFEVNGQTDPDREVLQQDLGQYGITKSAIELTQEDTDDGWGLKICLDNDSSRWCQGLSFRREGLKDALAQAGQYRYLRFWVANPSDATISIMLQPEASGYNCAMNAPGAVLTRCDGEAVPTRTNNASGAGEDTSVVIPAGFYGWVSYAVADEPLSLWGSQVCDISRAESFRLDVRPGAPGAAQYYVLDDFMLSDSAAGSLREYKYQSTSKENYEEMRQELDSRIKSYLSVVPEVKYYPGYDPAGKGNIRALTYEGAEIDGKKTKVFAYIGYPEGAKSGDKLPAVVLVHGGGGHAFSDWVKEWNDRGYVAIAMDNTGFFPNSAAATGDGKDWTWGLSNCPDFREDGYADVMQTDHYATSGQPIEHQWMYHAVVQSILAHNLLKNDPVVDGDSIGITGISWGGIITALTIGYDKYAFAVPQYCSGYLDESLTYSGKYCKDYPAYDYLWRAEDRFDNIDFPVLFLQWTKDTSASPNTNSLCYLHTKEQGGELSFIMNWNHYHDRSQKIVYYYADCAVSGRRALAKAVNEPEGRHPDFEITIPEGAEISAKIWYTKEELKPESDKNIWYSAQADVSGDRVTGEVPEEAVLYYVEFTNRVGGESYFSATSIVTPD